MEYLAIYRGATITLLQGCNYLQPTIDKNQVYTHGQRSEIKC